MIAGLILAAYSVIGLLTARISYVKVYRDTMAKAWIPEDATEAHVGLARDRAHREARPLSTMLALTWPVSVPLTYLFKILHCTCKQFVVGAVKPTENERAWELAQRERELAKNVKALEHETDRLRAGTDDLADEPDDRPGGWRPETMAEHLAAESAHCKLIEDLEDHGVTGYPMPRSHREYAAGLRVLRSFQDAEARNA